MKTTCKIRSYVDEDKEAVLTLLRLNTPKYFAVEEEVELIRYLEEEIELYFVLEQEGKIIGSGGVNFEENKTIGIISWGIIHPEFQGKSFGSQLLIHRINLLKTLKVQQILVRTAQTVYLFYQKHGFEIKDVKIDYWAPGFDLYLMKHKE